MFDIHQSICDADSGEIDRDAFADYAQELLDEFVDSYEGQAFGDLYADFRYAEIVIDYAVDYLGLTPPEMAPRDFTEVFFEIIPRRVSTRAEQAERIVAELTAFWCFLERAYGLKNAAGILAILRNRAVERLARELSNPGNFGMAKSFMMMGDKLGFDMRTQAGLDALVLHYNTNLLNQQAGGMTLSPVSEMSVNEFGDSDENNDEYSAPTIPQHTPKERAEIRKKKRKVERQARKRQRRQKS